MRRLAIRNLTSLVLLLVIYYAAPSKVFPAAEATAISVTGLVVSVAVLGALIAYQLRRHLRVREGEAVRVESLLILAYLTVTVFALGYFVLERSSPGQFVGMETKTDALYFTMTTLATAGFGDVVPLSQVARALVTLQIVFNLVFIGVLVRMLTRVVHDRATAAANTDSV